MKKILVILFSGFIITGLTGCGNDNKNEEVVDQKTSTTTTTEAKEQEETTTTTTKKSTTTKKTTTTASYYANKKQYTAHYLLTGDKKDITESVILVTGNYKGYIYETQCNKDLLDYEFTYSVENKDNKPYKVTFKYPDGKKDIFNVTEVSKDGIIKKMSLDSKKSDKVLGSCYKDSIADYMVSES